RTTAQLFQLSRCEVQWRWPCQVDPRFDQQFEPIRKQCIHGGISWRPMNRLHGIRKFAKWCYISGRKNPPPHLNDTRRYLCRAPITPLRSIAAPAEKRAQKTGVQQWIKLALKSRALGPPVSGRRSDFVVSDSFLCCLIPRHAPSFWFY